ncbi:MAG: 3-phosphoshikimate 1-carboxyvinyltransferase [Dehalococcoidia bacterium]
MIKSVRRPRSLRGELEVPGDKSITHRALIFNALAGGPATVRHGSRGDDCLATVRCLRALGADLAETGPDQVGICRGDGLAEPAEPLDAGNSGTTMRLLTGLLAAQPFRSVITGDDSLRRRPMDRVIEPLTRMGADVRSATGDGRAPLEITGARLRGIRYRLPVASAQVKSAVLIAGLAADGETVVEEPHPTRDHTELMLRAMGADIETRPGRIALRPGPLTALDVAVPGDLSSAAYWLVAAVLHPDAEVVVRGVGVNPTRAGILDALAEMGADLSVERERTVGGEPVADIRARSSDLRGITVSGELTLRCIDELPLLAVAGAMARSVTEIRDAAELRVKESDRIANTAAELGRLGVTVEERPDGLAIHGRGRLDGGGCFSYGDHRLAMALAVAGLVADGVTEVQDAEAVSVSYPDFWHDLDRLAGIDSVAGAVAD